MRAAEEMENLREQVLVPKMTFSLQAARDWRGINGLLAALDLVGPDLQLVLGLSSR